MNPNEEKIILITINLLNQLNIIKNNTKDENTYCEIREMINFHKKNLKKLGIKMIYLEGIYSIVDCVPTLISKL
jgi:hypothetical protein